MAATVGATRPYTLFQAEAFDLDSVLFGRRYEISVALPLSYGASPDRGYPVLVVLDANLCFATAVEAVRLISLGQEIEEMVVVGVGCPWSEGFESFGRRRSHEFTPIERWDMDGPFGDVTKALFATMNPPATFGGAPVFLELLTSEVLASVAARYRVDLTTPGLFGDSSGGTFALFALLSERSPFKRYIIGSPATAQCNDELYRMEERYAASHQDLDANVFLAAGAEEMMSPMLEGGGIASGVCRFSGLLSMRQYPNLRLTSHLFPDEGHVSVVPGLIARGLRTLYPNGRKYGAMAG